jgi:hypothetical protein
MRIGIDFDNTIVSYDALFHRVAAEQGVIPAGTPRTKIAVRDHLRREGREEIWTEMQGTVYGARMDEAQAYPGAMEFLQWASAQGIAVSIISHKTRHPFIGPRHDLHQAARLWVERHLANSARPLVHMGDVFFELTKEEKVRRIGAAACDYFIDDLPEILLAQEFPGDIRRILFDPESHHEDAAALQRMRRWSDILSYFRRECPSPQ